MERKGFEIYSFQIIEGAQAPLMIVLYFRVNEMPSTKVALALTRQVSALLGGVQPVAKLFTKDMLVEGPDLMPELGHEAYSWLQCWIDRCTTLLSRGPRE